MTIFLGARTVIGDQDVDPDLEAEVTKRSREMAELLFSTDRSLRHNLIGSMVLTWMAAEPDPPWALLQLIAAVTQALPDAVEQTNATMEARGSTKQ